MKKVSLLLLLVIIATGCASTSATSSSLGGGDGASLRGASPTHYRLLSDPRHVREIDWSRPPLGLHVKGTLTSAGFQAGGAVEGRGGFCEGGTDFVTLSNGQFHAASSGSPSGDYVLGCKGITGGFAPASREILR